MSSDTDPLDSAESPDFQALDAWLAGEATASEQETVREWMSADPRRAEFVESLRSAISSPPLAAAPDLDRAWAATLRRAPRRSFRIDRIAVAAGLVLAVGLGVAWMRGRDRPFDIATGPGERATRTMSDGTRITLGAGSRIQYAGRTNTGRDVRLEGEAMFEVKHDASRTFRVISNGSVVTDIGTRFVVRGYPELDHVDVAVTEGEVSLRQETGSAGLVLTAGMVGSVTRSGVLTQASSAGATDGMTAWTTGGLHFSAAPLGDVAAQLRRRYGVEIRFADSSLAIRRLTTNLQDETLDNALDAISVALSLRYERRADTVAFRARP